jgi:signal transduction histidine kinase
VQIQTRLYSPATLLLLDVFVLAMIGLYVFPVDSLPRTLVARGAGLIFAVTMLLSVLRMPADLRPFWLLFWFYLATTVAADLTLLYQQKTMDSPAGIGLPDLLYMSSYGFAFAGFALLAHRSSRAQQVNIAIDAAIIGLAALAVVCSLHIGPLIAQAQTVDATLLISVTYPVLDIFVFTALVRVNVLSTQRNPAILLLSAAMLTFLLIDLVYSYTTANGSGFDIETPWLAALAMMALAASLPGAQDRMILAKGEGDHLTPLRGVLVALAVLLPLAMALQDLWWGGGHNVFATIVLGAAATALVLFRAYGLVDTVQKQSSDLKLLLQKETKARQEAEAARQAAEAANVAKSEFLSVMSHELRTPLTVIQGMNQLIAISKDLGTAKKFAAKGTESSQHLLKIIEDILDFSSIEAGHLSIVRAPFRIGVLLDEVSDMLGGLRREGVELRFDLAADLQSPEFVSDALRIKQILINLAGNALKFTDHGSVVVSVRRCGGSAAAPLIEFAVADTGAGLTPDQQSRLFQPFTQLDMSSTRRNGGVGMGLVISQRLVKLLGGEPIALESRPGVGSRFSFRLALPVA